MIHYAVENILFSPALDNQYYPTSLNCYDCDPFNMYWSVPDQETLLNDLANLSVGNFTGTDMETLLQLDHQQQELMGFQVLAILKLAISCQLWTL